VAKKAEKAYASAQAAPGSRCESEATLARTWGNVMDFQIEPEHALSPHEIAAIEDRLYEHNSHATGRHDVEAWASSFAIRGDG
jgi:hypothetical protein